MYAQGANYHVTFRRVSNFLSTILLVSHHIDHKCDVVQLGTDKNVSQYTEVLLYHMI